MECRPVWWPDDVPWANVRSDVRTTEQKKKVDYYLQVFLQHDPYDNVNNFCLYKVVFFFILVSIETTGTWNTFFVRAQFNKAFVRHLYD